MADVAVKACQGYDQPDLGRAVAQAVELCGGMGRFVRPGQNVLLKPNLLGAYEPDRRVTTDPAVVVAVGRLVLDHGGRPIIGDSPAIDPFGRAAAKSGLAQAARQLEAPLVELLEPTPTPTPPTAIRRRLDLARAAVQADVIINLPKLKTHCMMLLTMGVKNLFGAVVAQRKSEWHLAVGQSRLAFADLLLDIQQTLRPALTILDGVWAMEGRGPSNGAPRRTGFIAASADALALDVAVCPLLGVEPGRYPIFQAAVARGLIDPAQPPRLLGDEPALVATRDFQTPELEPTTMLPPLLARLLGRRLIARPVQEPGLCRACGKCAAICPAGCLRLEGRRASFDHDRCIRCYCCHEVCPVGAITFKRGLVAGLLERLGR